MVAVRDSGHAVLLESGLHARDALAGLQHVVQSPAHDVAAVPVDDAGQVDMAAAQWDVGYVGGPDLVGEHDPLSSQ